MNHEMHSRYCKILQLYPLVIFPQIIFKYLFKVKHFLNLYVQKCPNQLSRWKEKPHFWNKLKDKKVTNLSKQSKKLKIDFTHQACFTELADFVSPRLKGILRKDIFNFFPLTLAYTILYTQRSSKIQYQLKSKTFCIYTLQTIKIHLEITVGTGIQQVLVRFDHIYFIKTIHTSAEHMQEGNSTLFHIFEQKWIRQK